jgi:hypothetical protein
MHSLEDGFWVGSRTCRWGVTFAELAAEMTSIDDQRTSHSFTAPCDEALGLSTISVEATASRSDRPVTQLCYQLAPVAGEVLPDRDIFTGPLSNAFGDPRTATEYDLPASGEPSGSVRYYAGWDVGDFSVGLSLYGAARRTEFGSAPGCIWLSWSPVKAARPYLAEWRERGRELAGEEPADIAGFRFQAEQLPVFGNGGKKDSAEAALREANIALYHPELLPTPLAISALVGKHGAMFWRRKDGRWCASTCWDTICFGAEESAVSWNDIAPAKGGGFSEIAIGRWSVRDWHNSRPVRDAVDHLETICGVRVNHVTGYDC